jgi:hypothetical protein
MDRRWGERCGSDSARLAHAEGPVRLPLRDGLRPAVAELRRGVLRSLTGPPQPNGGIFAEFDVPEAGEPIRVRFDLGHLRDRDGTDEQGGAEGPTRDRPIGPHDEIDRPRASGKGRLEARGGTFAGTATLGSVRSTFGESGTIRFGKLSLTAFGGQVARDPSLATMPPDGVIGPSGPDFIPMVGTGTSIVGYVATRWQLDLPLNSFRARAPDQPVFASDLKTIVGYSVPGHGFQAGS